MPVIAATELVGSLFTRGPVFEKFQKLQQTWPGFRFQETLTGASIGLSRVSARDAEPLWQKPSSKRSLSYPAQIPNNQDCWAAVTTMYHPAPIFLHWYQT